MNKRQLSYIEENLERAQHDLTELLKLYEI